MKVEIETDSGLFSFDNVSGKFRFFFEDLDGKPLSVVEALKLGILLGNICDPEEDWQNLSFFTNDLATNVDKPLKIKLWEE